MNGYFSSLMLTALHLSVAYQSTSIAMNPLQGSVDAPRASSNRCSICFNNIDFSSLTATGDKYFYAIQRKEKQNFKKGFEKLKRTFQFTKTPVRNTLVFKSTSYQHNSSHLFHFDCLLRWAIKDGSCQSYGTDNSCTFEEMIGAFIQGAIEEGLEGDELSHLLENIGPNKFLYSLCITDLNREQLQKLQDLIRNSNNKDKDEILSSLNNFKDVLEYDYVLKYLKNLEDTIDPSILYNLAELINSNSHFAIYFANRLSVIVNRNPKSEINHENLKALFTIILSSSGDGNLKYLEDIFAKHKSILGFDFISHVFERGSLLKNYNTLTKFIRKNCSLSSSELLRIISKAFENNPSDKSKARILQHLPLDNLECDDFETILSYYLKLDEHHISIANAFGTYFSKLSLNEFTEISNMIIINGCNKAIFSALLRSVNRSFLTNDLITDVLKTMKKFECPSCEFIIHILLDLQVINDHSFILVYSQVKELFGIREATICLLDLLSRIDQKTANQIFNDLRRNDFIAEMLVAVHFISDIDFLQSMWQSDIYKMLKLMFDLNIYIPYPEATMFYYCHFLLILELGIEKNTKESIDFIIRVLRSPQFKKYNHEANLIRALGCIMHNKSITMFQFLMDNLPLRQKRMSD